MASPQCLTKFYQWLSNHFTQFQHFLGNQFPNWSWSKFFKTIGVLSFIGGICALEAHAYVDKQFFFGEVVGIIAIFLVIGWIRTGVCADHDLEAVKERLDGWENKWTRSFFFLLTLMGSVTILWYDRVPSVADPLTLLG